MSHSAWTSGDFVPWPAEEAASYRSSGYWAGLTFGELLARRAAESGERRAVRDRHRTLTYRQLDEAASSFATGLRDLGIRPGDRVLLQIPNRAEFLEALYALFRLGAVPVMCLPAHRHAELAAIAEASSAVALIVARDGDGFSYLDLAQRIRQDVPSLRHVIAAGPATARAVSTAGADLDDLYPPAAELPAPSADAVALLQLSGGSTGLPKLIPRTHDDYLYSVRRSIEVCGIDESSVYLAVLPASHNFTLSSAGILGALVAGGTVALTEDPSPSSAFAFIKETGTTITALVPPLARVWVNTAEQSAAPELDTLQVVQIGGARCPAELAARIRPALGASVQQVFGMAEGLVCYTRLDDPEDIAVATQGRPMSDGDQLLVVDDHDRPVEAGASGHLLTRGPYTIRGYFRNPAANRRSFTDDGWYRTGDIVSIRPDGNLVVVGRSGDFINRSGEKLSPEELEQHLLKHPLVDDVIAVGMADDMLGERTCVFVVPSAADTAPSLTDLRTFARQNGLADWKLPDEVRVVQEFPKTKVGKASRADLRAILRG
ncbi:(2,3-dihydroxybenzoyl)adenylate synthase [Streptomyces sp. TLI_105]|uniref:(2,3-dihydroxybenzoyl)adenylate synthase n=1 Tax=Streptomyces sp. TLI_105 TaxID=1881019 RepID=UPI0008988E31|nr:AMP-binding protein [Streptomyces sp. TLI_105]SEC31753.1 2,3-dihydroxybenzoate-AMP ligase [Streptomyces sp. TLI_105]